MTVGYGSPGFKALRGRGVRIAVIDSGWNRSVRDSRVLPGVGIVQGSTPHSPLVCLDDHDRIGHGTQSIRLVLENAPAAAVLPIRVFDSGLETSVARLLVALRYAIDAAVEVITMSLATRRSDALLPLYEVCEKATGKGATVVAAAFRRSGAGFPAVFASVIGVEAGDVAAPQEYWFRRHTAIECLALGTVARSATFDWCKSNSVATARVAGILALFREQHQSATPDEARLWLASHATKVIG